VSIHPVKVGTNGGGRCGVSKLASGGGAGMVSEGGRDYLLRA
jgi:hypothetical protein